MAASWSPPRFVAPFDALPLCLPQVSPSKAALSGRAPPPPQWPPAHEGWRLATAPPRAIPDLAHTGVRTPFTYQGPQYLRPDGSISSELRGGIRTAMRALPNMPVADYHDVRYLDYERSVVRAAATGYDPAEAAMARADGRAASSRGGSLASGSVAAEASSVLGGGGGRAAGGSAGSMGRHAAAVLEPPPQQQQQQQQQQQRWPDGLAGRPGGAHGVTHGGRGGEGLRTPGVTPGPAGSEADLRGSAGESHGSSSGGPATLGTEGLLLAPNDSAAGEGAGLGTGGLASARSGGGGRAARRRAKAPALGARRKKPFSADSLLDCLLDLTYGPTDPKTANKPPSAKGTNDSGWDRGAIDAFRGLGPVGE